MSSSQRFSAEKYFSTQPPPPSLDSDISKVRSFISHHKEAGRRVVLVTSGGTTVPLELNVVRFLDNFSAGTRGATSAEYFLKSGYAVIFMHRQFSLQPFSRHYSHSTNPFLDLLETSNTSTAESPQICVNDAKVSALYPILLAYQKVQLEHTLLSLPFVTLTEYLFLLRSISQELSVLGPSAMYYLAAAVSDFFIPREKMSEHKIQSSSTEEDNASTAPSRNLSIEMDHTPKILKPMVDEWAKGGYVVSFKLETDDNLLIPKSRAALQRYGHQLVIGNQLHTRKHEVVFVEPTADTEGGFKETWLRIPTTSEEEIEADIVKSLMVRHGTWIGQNGK